ncbi:MAG: lipid IV(A) palmitoyltransferase PagP [Betaproteobacteria bacterium]|nr:lipid IV(A) palmitoyltransferase PagP [Betaproteobacteria bacterium]
MTHPFRHKPLDLLVCGIVGALAGGHVVEAQAQSGAPLRIDPALLGGRPPGKTAGQPAPSAGKAGIDTKPADGLDSPARISPASVADKPARGAPAPPRASATSPAPAAAAKKDPRSWFRRIWDPVAEAYSDGTYEAYLPLHTHHLRSAYTADQIANYQEYPPGLGIGRGLYNEKGNYQGVYVLGFQDSHFKPEWHLGYTWKAIWRPAEDFRLGLGYTAFLMARTDMGHYVPFPGIVPVASLAYKNLTLESTFIPGAAGRGNVVFFWAKWEFGKPGEAVGTPARSVAPEIGPVAGGAMPMTATDAGDGKPAPDEDGFPPLKKAGRDEATPTYIGAQRMYGINDRETVAEGAARLRKADMAVDADKMTYWSLDDEVEAAGKVRMVRGEDVVTGPKMRLKIEDQVGYFEQPSYFLKRKARAESRPAANAASAYGLTTAAGVPAASGFSQGFSSAAGWGAAPVSRMTEARGEAERFDFEGENQIRVTSGTYTTCKPGNDGWHARIGDLKLDYDREVAEGTNGAIYFQGVPILYSPWLSFSLNNQRKSGFLAPTFGSHSKSGIELTLPYYWNIAPNMDATVAPHALTKRGLQLNSEFRYLDSNTVGQARVELLPNDKVRNENRYGVSLQHTQNLGNGFAGAINFNKVSDDHYYTDLSSRISNTSQTQLLQQGLMTYGGGWWSATANLQSYQTLQPDPANPVLEPYRLLPQVTVVARKPDWHLTDTSFLGQYTSFQHPTQVQAQRAVLYPQVALPYVTPGWYVTPKLGVHASYYSLSRQAAGTPDTLGRTLPIFSVDSGMTFERESRWFGHDTTQTLEPRLFYLNVPYRDQSRIPVFDSALADFNFAQIFSENQFVGQDRISDANQLTAAVTSRLIDPGSGREIMRGMLGQRFYFREQQVTLPGQAKRVWTKSDFLAAFSGQILPKVYADAAVQYNVENSRAERYSVGARYNPEPGKTLNVAYRFNRDAIDQVDLTAQWPIYGGWHAVGRYNYSLKDRQPIENIAGLEYNGGCWVARLVGHRLATAQGVASTAIFFQLELNDFSRIGSNPLDLLKRNIQGYGKINQSTADPVFGQ